ncbi:hypothetical protein ACFSTA_16765 [Ornithinibacillus salinisoli]|uniref:YfjL-like C-terminal domain-containing protein n=1 Tax=Ornithinibacillus salinisoli TaxID=1848459 RepID=A0ABW4W0J5_9BACI
MEFFVQLDSTDQTKEEFLSATKKVMAVLDQQGYEYESILFNGSGFDLETKVKTEGYLKYSIKLVKDEVVKIGDVEEHNKDMQSRITFSI